MYPWEKVHGKCSNWLKNWQKCTLGYFLQLHGGILGYFAFFQFYGSRNAPRRQFWIKFVKIGNYRKIFWPKMFQMTSNLAKTCILVFFIDFQNFGIFHWKLADFRLKNAHFFAESAKILKTKFWRKINQVRGKCFHWPKNG